MPSHTTEGKRNTETQNSDKERMKSYAGILDRSNIWRPSHWVLYT